MKKNTASKARPSEAVVEYDFSKGVTGKYAARYWESVAPAKKKRPKKKTARTARTT